MQTHSSFRLGVTVPDTDARMVDGSGSASVQQSLAFNGGNLLLLPPAASDPVNVKQSIDGTE